MKQTIKVAPSNSIVFVSDTDGGIAPEAFRYDPIMSTPTCIVVGTLMQDDGDTAVTLAPFGDVARSDVSAFDGMLETPTGQVVVSVVDRTVLLEGRSGSACTRIRVWTNHPSEPDEIVIAYGP